MQARSTRKSVWHPRVCLALSAALGLTPPQANADERGLEPKPAEAISTPPAAQSFTELLLQADVNRQGLNEIVLVLRAADGSFLVSADDLDRWRLRRPQERAAHHRGVDYYALRDIPGTSALFDSATQTLEIEASAAAFTETVSPLLLAMPRNVPIVPQPGGFLNYDMAAMQSSGARSAAGLFEAGFFSSRGVLTSTALAADLPRSASWRRLETTYTIDQPDRLTSWRLGDSVTRAGAWGRAVRYGGVQFGTNFNTQPGFIRFPVASAAGQAALPSTVDVFVNNALVAQRSVPPGPFSITNIPMVSGSGDLRVVVRDVLGREQFITTPFYGSTVLLAAGLSDYSYEIGAQRSDFAIASGHYTTPTGAATYRRGISDFFTAEARAEFDHASAAAGAAGAWRVAHWGVLNTAAALSHSAEANGALLGYGLEHNARRFSAGLQSTLTTRAFRQAGMAPGELPRRRQTAANVGLQLGGWGSLSFTRAVQDFRGEPDIAVTTVGYSVPLGRLAQLNLSAVKTQGAAAGSAFFTTLAVPLDAVTSAVLSHDRTRSSLLGTTGNANTAVLQRSLPLGEGYGYRLQARERDLTGRAELQTAVGRWSAEAFKPEEGAGAYRLGAAGGVGAVGGEYFLSRSITESFAVVRVGDYPNVRVLQDNQVVARTDERGRAILPRLRAYDRNPIALEQNDLPFDAKIGNLKLEAVPYFRSGVLVDFPVQRVRAATLRIVLGDGGDLPAGAVARIEGKPAEFPVALRGEVYLDGFDDQNRVVITWKQQTCTLEVTYPRTADPLPHLGVRVCRGVLP